MNRRILVAAACAVLGALQLACAGAPTYHYAFDPTFKFTPPKTYAWYDDPKFQMPGGSSIVDGRFIDEHIRQEVDETLAKKGVLPAPTGATPDIYVSYTTRPDAVADQDRWGAYNWWGVSIYAGTKYRKQGTLFIDIRDSSHRLVWRGLKTTLLGTNPDAIAKDIHRAVTELLAEYPPPPGAKNEVAPK